MPYVALVKESFEIVRRNRFLWFYGLFAGGATFNFPASFPSDSGDGSADPVPSVDPEVVAVIALAVLTLALVLAALSIVSQGALADSVAAIRSGERRSFGRAWRSGLRSFWRMLGLGVVFALIGLVLLLAVVLPVAAVIVAVALASDSVVPIVVAAIGAGIPGIVVLFALLLVLGVTAQLAVRHAVVARAGITDSLRVGWRLLRDNLIPSGAMLLIQQVATFVSSIGILLAVLLLSLPAIVLLVAGATTVGIVAAALTALIVIPLALTAYGALGAFNHSLWTLGYLELMRRGWDSNPRSA